MDFCCSSHRQVHQSRRPLSHGVTGLLPVLERRFFEIDVDGYSSVTGG
jgi:hypothetical protein